MNNFRFDTRWLCDHVKMYLVGSSFNISKICMHIIHIFMATFAFVANSSSCFLFFVFFVSSSAFASHRCIWYELDGLAAVCGFAGEYYITDWMPSDRVFFSVKIRNNIVNEASCRVPRHAICGIHDIMCIKHWIIVGSSQFHAFHFHKVINYHNADKLYLNLKAKYRMINEIFASFIHETPFIYH